MSRTVKTVVTLADLPGAYERGVDEILRRLSVRYRTRFYVVQDDRDVACSDDIRLGDDHPGSEA